MKLFSDFFRKDAVAADAHVSTALGNEGGGRKRAKLFRAFFGGRAKPVEVTAEKHDTDWSITAPVSKVDEEIGVIYGWASVIEENGQVVTDHQDDQITVTDLLKAAHEFMLSSRTGGLMHWRDGDAPLKGGDVAQRIRQPTKFNFTQVRHSRADLSSATQISSRPCENARAALWTCPAA